MNPVFLMPLGFKPDNLVDTMTLKTNKSQRCMKSLGAEEITAVKTIQEYLIPNLPGSLLDIGETSFELFIHAIAVIPEIYYANSSCNPLLNGLTPILRSVCLAPDDPTG